MPLLLGWSGMRGVVSLAAALAIPIHLSNGSEFPHRNLILFITFVAILLTLVVQGITLPILIRRSHIFDNYPGEDPEGPARHKVKQGLKQHSYRFLKEKHETEYSGHEGMGNLLNLWEAKLTSADDGHMDQTTKTVFLQLLESQRQYLTDLNKDPDIAEEIIRLELYQIDLEEERLNRM